MNPGASFADEPTGNLDLEAREQVAALLLEKAQGRVLVLVTHDPELAARADWRLYLKGGRLARVEESPKIA